MELRRAAHYAADCEAYVSAKPESTINNFLGNLRSVSSISVMSIYVKNDGEICFQFAL